MDSAGSPAPARKKKVLFIITKSNFGGAQRYVYDLATSIPQEEFDPVVLLGPGPGEKTGGTLYRMLREAHIRTIFVPELTRDVHAWSDLRTFNIIAGAIRVERPDIVHLNSSKAAGLGALAARLLGVPRVIFTAHGWPFHEERPWIQQRIIHAASWLTALLSDTIVCVSELDASAGRRMPFIGGRIVRVYNGIAEFPLVPREEARRVLVGEQRAAAHAGDTWIITNAELTPNKNIRAGLDVMRSLGAVPAFYVIMSDGEDRVALEQAAAEAGLSDRIAFTGFVDDGRRYLAAADIFFLPSKKEGLPYAILEAGRASLPVVASSVGGIPEIVIDGVSGYLRASTDIDGFSASLSLLIRDAALRERIGSALHDSVFRRFSQDAMRSATFSLYRERPRSHR